MKLRKGRATYKLPPIGIVFGGYLHFKDHIYSMMHVDDKTINREPILATPQMFYINKTKTTITFWPVPDRAMEFGLRYYPPVKEI